MERDHVSCPGLARGRTAGLQSAGRLTRARGGRARRPDWCRGRWLGSVAATPSPRPGPLLLRNCPEMRRLCLAGLLSKWTCALPHLCLLIRSLLPSPSLFWGPPCPSVPSLGQRSLPPAGQPSPGWTGSLLPTGSVPGLGASEPGEGAEGPGAAGSRTMRRSPGAFRYANQGNNRCTDGEIESLSGEGFAQECPVGLGSAGPCPGRCPRC